jgi:hypothetical protein
MEGYENYIWRSSDNKDLEEWKKSSNGFTCELDQIGQKYNCDKSSVQYMSAENRNIPYSWPAGLNLKIAGHNYLQVYSDYFTPVRYEKINLLEIGMGNYPTNGYSMRMWLEFFPNAQLTILDSNSGNFHYDFPFDKDRVKTRTVDQSSSSDLDNLVLEFENEKFDFIIDDGSHQADHQILSFNKLFPRILKDSGTYFIEDIHDRKFTDYLPDLYFNLNHGELSGQYRLEDSSFDLDISSITMHRSLICIQKGKKITR